MKTRLSILIIFLLILGISVSAQTSSIDFFGRPRTQVYIDDVLIGSSGRDNIGLSVKNVSEDLHLITTVDRRGNTQNERVMIRADKHYNYYMIEEDKIPNTKSTKTGLELVVPDDELVFATVEEMPLFNNGIATVEFRKFIEENMVYPLEASNQGLSGTVFVQFIVNTHGYLEDIKLVRAQHEILDQEALRVISSSPRWTPGKQKGETVKVMYTFPIKFSPVN